MKTVLIFLTVLLSLAACTKGGGGLNDESGITITHARMLPAGKGMNSGAFLKIKNNSGEADTLIGAEFEEAYSVQIHKSFLREDGRRGMEEIKVLPIPPGETVELEPMSYHIMLIRLKEDIGIGSDKALTLIFSKAGRIKTSITVD